MRKGNRSFPGSVVGDSLLVGYFLVQLLMAVPVGVGQVYGCDCPWTGGIFIIALLLSSPTICMHAVLGSIVGVVSGKRLPLRELCTPDL